MDVNDSGASTDCNSGGNKIIDNCDGDNNEISGDLNVTGSAVDDDTASEKEKLPTDIVVKKKGDHQSPDFTPGNSDQSSVTPNHEDNDAEEHTTTRDNDSISSSSSSSSKSLELNPNTSLDKIDLPGIALLKEIFPEESTNNLRKLHYKHIILNKTSSSSPTSMEFNEMPSESNPTIIKTNTTSIIKRPEESSQSDQENDKIREQNSTTRFTNIPSFYLPDDDFLRLPKSVAVLRRRQHASTNEDDRIQTYEFIQDLEMRALEEYHLATTGSSTNREGNSGQKYVEYNTYVVDKDDRLGLGMTLQEAIDDDIPPPGTNFDMQHVPQQTFIRYGLKVIGFLPNPKKVENGETDENWNSRSPARIAGIQCDDVLIGINGTAFLLQVPSSPSYSVDRSNEHYKIQKEKIIRSIQNSPNPVVLHIRRRRKRSSIEKKFSERRMNSLLDATIIPDHTDSESAATRHIGQRLQSPSLSATSKASLPHPLSIALVRRKLISPGEDQWRITRRLYQFTERARQYESSNSLRITLTGRGGSKKGSLVPHFDPKDLPPDMVIPKDGDLQESKYMEEKDTRIDEIKHNSPSSTLSTEVDTQSYPGMGTSTASTPPLPFDSPLIPIEYLQAFYGYDKAQEIRSKSASIMFSGSESQFSPNRLFWPQQSAQRTIEYQDPTYGFENTDDVAWIPLHGVRKAISARIVNSFVESTGSNPSTNNNVKSRIAYTIWVYDVESGREWYAPIRYWKDFFDLREAALSLLPSNSNGHKELSVLKLEKDPTIPNDSNSGWGVSVFGSPSMVSNKSPLQQRRRKRRNDEFDQARQHTSQSLEAFLRELLGMIYTCDPLHPRAAEIALYVQSFLGVDGGLEDSSESFSNTSSFTSDSKSREEETEQFLKRSIQRYTWRIFLLHTMKAIVKDFVDATLKRGPKLNEFESIDTDTNVLLKARAMDELSLIQRFLDQLVDLILDGCKDDLRLISKRREYASIHKKLADESYWDRIAREAVREQVEIEVYVPLRSVVSRLLVNGWRHEDMEVHFKIKELRKRPQGMFRIDKISPSHWQSVAQILKQGVGMSTLPCVKLRAIVDAAREISQLHKFEHGGEQLLGADDFLPIFIFCVVRAEMERPCALSILLQTLCDRINRIGEIGYFLASFEASIAHIKEIDLTEDREDELSFLTVPLAEISAHSE